MKVELIDCVRPASPRQRPLTSHPSSFKEGQDLDWGIDQTALLGNCIGNGAFAVSLLNEFGKTGLANVRAILSHALAGRFVDTALAAHSLKGSAAIIGAKKLSSLAASVERSSSDVDRNRLCTQLVELEQEMCDCLQQIPTIRVSIGDKVAVLPQVRTVNT